MEQQTSGLKFRSLGIVTKAKSRGSDIIQVDPIEDFVLDKGALTPDSKKLAVDLPNIQGVNKNTKLTGGSVITAKWIPFGQSNRETAPDVQPGETVMIFQFADTQDYHWTTQFREPTLRRLEHVRHSYSNQPGGSNAYGDDTSYWLEFSTVDKHIKLHTSDNDGEAAKYDIEINTRDGTISIQDNLGNSINLDSVGGHLATETTASVQVKTKLYKVDAEETVINTGTFLLKSGETTIDASRLAMSSVELATLEANFDVKGNVSADGTVIDGGGNTPNHSH